jgi:peptidoglycan-N-acetylglucosamine deacetylase
MTARNLGTVQIDLDGLWTNLNYYGHKSYIYPDNVFESSVPRFLDLFERFGIKATFFLVGQDAEISEKAVLVKELVRAGHEIANHTYTHPFGLRKLPPVEKFAEIKKSEEIITKVTGKKPVGFKAPGYDLDVETLKFLSKKNYLYDSSVIPTFVYPLIMKMNQVVSGGVKRTHGPRWSWALAPNKMYRPSARNEWQRGNLRIKELPCSTIPLVKLPYHATFAQKLGLNYFKLGFNLTRLMNASLNYEFHATDLCDKITDPRLPHLQTDFPKRYKICKNILKTLSNKYNLVTSKEFVERKFHGN